MKKYYLVSLQKNYELTRILMNMFFVVIFNAHNTIISVEKLIKTKKSIIK